MRANEYGFPGRCFRSLETGGSRWKELRKLLDPTEKHWNNKPKMEAVFRSYVLRFLPVTSWPFPAKNSLENGQKSRNRRNTPVNGRNLSGKIRRVSGWNTASIFRILFWCCPAGTGPYFSTWAWKTYN